MMMGMCFIELGMVVAESGILHGNPLKLRVICIASADLLDVVTRRIHQYAVCLKGFKPKNIDEWNLGNWTSGCVRNISLQCSNIGGKEDGFLGLPHVKVPDNAGYILFLDDPDECRSMCLGNCSCLAYAYPKRTVCMMWNESLIDMQQFSVDGVEVFIRLAHSELGNHLFLAFLLF